MFLSDYLLTGVGFPTLHQPIISSVYDLHCYSLFYFFVYGCFTPEILATGCHVPLRRTTIVTSHHRIGPISPVSMHHLSCSLDRPCLYGWRICDWK